jgi:hypothetical protein
MTRKSSADWNVRKREHMMFLKALFRKWKELDHIELDLCGPANIRSSLNPNSYFYSTVK